MRFWMMAAAALIAAAPASAQLVLEPGQGASVTIDANGKVATGKVHPAALGPHDLDALKQMRIAYKITQPSEGILPPVMMTEGEVTMPAVASGRIEIVFVVVGEKDSVLVMLNGYDRGLMYRATITARGRTGPTDVCLVVPGLRGYEHWPYAIERIELTAFTLVDWKNGDPVPCR